MKIAIIGTGIAGLSTAWALNQKYDITVFEKRDRLGGHSHTVDASPDLPIDTGFIVYNDWTYPYLIQLFKHLDVPVKRSDMSFAVSVDKGALEYAGDSLNKIFAQRKNLFSPSYWRMLRDITKFYYQAPIWVERHPNSRVTLGRFLEHYKYSDAFINNHLIPMGSAIWSTPADKMLEFPASTFIHFCQNHGLLQISRRPTWRTVDGGSREYVSRLTADFKNKIKVGEKVSHVLRGQDSVTITAIKDGETNIYSFDQVVIATHGDDALTLLQNPSDEETDVLSGFTYSKNETYLHTDATLLPKKKKVWSSWNYMADTTSDQTAVSVTYWMNRLQNLDTDTDYFVSLNPLRIPDEDTIIKKMVYHHPMFNAKMIDAQQKLHTIQGVNRTWFCGSYAGYGFHEDALCSGLAVAKALGVSVPWDTLKPSSPAGLNTIKNQEINDD